LATGLQEGTQTVEQSGGKSLQRGGYRRPALPRGTNAHARLGLTDRLALERFDLHAHLDTYRLAATTATIVGARKLELISRQPIAVLQRLGVPVQTEAIEFEPDRVWEDLHRAGVLPEALAMEEVASVLLPAEDHAEFGTGRQLREKLTDTRHRQTRGRF